MDASITFKHSEDQNSNHKFSVQCHKQHNFPNMALKPGPVPQVFVLDRVLEEDGITGDQYGPYDEEFIAEERDRQQYDKVMHTFKRC